MDAMGTLVVVAVFQTIVSLQEGTSFLKIKKRDGDASCKDNANIAAKRRCLLLKPTDCMKGKRNSSFKILKNKKYGSSEGKGRDAMIIILWLEQELGPRNRVCGRNRWFELPHVGESGCASADTECIGYRGCPGAPVPSLFLGWFRPDEVGDRGVE